VSEFALCFLRTLRKECVSLYSSILGFSHDDVFTTSNTPSDFLGSFVVMSDQVLYLSRETARAYVLSRPEGNYELPGTRC